jgi:hypothetical protein
VIRSALPILFVLAVGCSSIPEGGDPGPAVRALVGPSRGTLGRISIAPISSIVLAPDESAKGWRTQETAAIDAEKIRADVARAVEATGAFDRTRSAGHDALSEAWTQGDDFVATVTIENLRTHYDGRNGWWIPNIANWLFWIVPAWWVATEEYSLTLEARLLITSGESGLPLVEKKIDVKVGGSFDEFDRGWQFFGFIYSSLDAEGWRGIATRLFPAAQRELAVQVALAAQESLRAGSSGLDAARRKTLAVVVGVSRYEDSVRYPPLPFAADDARAVRDALLRDGRPPEHVLVLLDGGATVAAVRSSATAHLQRAREGDSVVFYFAGYGTRAPDGAPVLLLSDANGQMGSLPLDELAALLSRGAGKKLALVDSSFSGGERSVRGGSSRARDDLAAFSGGAGAAILAGGPDEPALAPPPLASGLFTYHLIRGLEGPADSDHNGRVDARELFDYVRGRVVAESSLLGHPQTPRSSAPAAGASLPVCREPDQGHRAQ